jgi:iron complex transport system ATP-binding protein
MPSKLLIRASEVAFSYNGASLLEGVTLGLPSGCLSALIGANGSGKSTLLRLFCGLERPGSGTIELDGSSIQSLPQPVRARLVAYVPQNAPVVFPFTALEVVLTGRNPHLSSFAVESRKDLRIALDALERVGMSHVADRPVTVLSGGERQLVFVARAIAQDPKLMLLDEPSGFLDLKHRAQLVRVLRSLRDERSITSLVVTHDLTFLEPSFDEVFALSRGRIVAKGLPSEVLHAPTLRETYSVAIETRHEAGKIFVWSEV